MSVENIGPCGCCGENSCDCCSFVCDNYEQLWATVECSGQSFQLNRISPFPCRFQGNSAVACGGEIGLVCGPTEEYWQTELQIAGSACNGVGLIRCDLSFCNPLHLVFDVELTYRGGSCNCPSICRVIVTE